MKNKTQLKSLLALPLGLAINIVAIEPPAAVAECFTCENRRCTPTLEAACYTCWDNEAHTSCMADWGYCSQIC